MTTSKKSWQKNYRKHKDRVKQNISYCLRFSPPKFCSGSTPQCHLSILNGGRGIKSGRGIVQNDFNNRIRSEITDIHLGGWEEILSELLSHFLWIFSFGRNSNCTHARHDAAGGIDVNWKGVMEQFKARQTARFNVTESVQVAGTWWPHNRRIQLQTVSWLAGFSH